MRNLDLITRLLFLSLLVPLSSSSPSLSLTSTTSNVSTTTTPPCPLFLNFVSTFRWNTPPCQNQLTIKENTSICCQTLLSLYGLALAQRLRETNLFQLPDIDTSVSCLRDFQSNLTSMSLPDNLVSSCFVPSQFVITNTTCAGIRSTGDWANRLDQLFTDELNSACGLDLADLSSCDSCVSAGFKVQAQLITVSGNTSSATECFYFTILYAAGISNSNGPLSYGVISCILSIALTNSTDNSAAPTDDDHQQKQNNSNLVPVLTGVSVSILFLSICCLLGLYLWCHRGRTRARRSQQSKLRFGFDGMNPGSRMRVVHYTGSIWFKLHDLEEATDNFSPLNFIGQGGFGSVYKGILLDGTEVAIKKIIGSDFQEDKEFCNEIEVISNLRHRNLVPLRGCCRLVMGDPNNSDETDTEWFLVYDYMPNGNLGDHLFPDSKNAINQYVNKRLTWLQRKNIILDVARGLAYLHYGVQPAIFHRDIKASNILLDADMRARLADFGLARQSKEDQSHLTTRVAGTHGYLAPEYALYGQLTAKNDVYSFGIVVLEVMTGRRALDSSYLESPGIHSIADWARSLMKAEKIEAALDASLLKDEYDQTSSARSVMERFVLVGILCTHVTAALRPTIADALRMLEGDTEVPPIPEVPMSPLGHPLYF